MMKYYQKLWGDQAPNKKENKEERNHLMFWSYYLDEPLATELQI